jgi:ribosome-binding protein aMBF1 (putative translation factor)
VTAPSAEIGRIVAEARTRRGWSQPELARRLGEHRHSGQVSKVENGYGVSLRVLLEIIEQMPEVGGAVIRMVRRAQRAHLEQRRQQH